MSTNLNVLCVDAGCVSGRSASFVLRRLGFFDDLLNLVMEVSVDYCGCYQGGGLKYSRRLDRLNEFTQ